MDDEHKSRGELIAELRVLREKIQVSESPASGATQTEVGLDCEREEYLREVLEKIKEVFWIAKTDLSEIIYISPNYEAIWGQSCSSLYNDPKSWMDAIHPMDSERVRSAINPRIPAGHALEYRIVRPDGSVRWISDRGFPIGKTDDARDRIAGLAEDITDRKRAEEELRESEERYRTAIEGSPDGVAVVRGKDIIYSNKRLVQMFGYDVSDPKINTEDAVHPEDLPIIYDYISRRQQGDPSVPSRYEFRGIKKDGTIIFIEASACRISYQGEAASLVYFRDITQRRKVEQALREYEKIVEGSQDLMVVVDRNYHYRLANETFLKYRNLRREELIDHSCFEVLGTDVFEKTAKRYLDRCFLGETLQYEMKREYPGLGEKDMLVSYLPIKSAQGIDRVAIIIRDITQNKEYEQALRESEKRYRSLFDTMPDGFVSAGMDKRISETNDAFRVMVGYSYDELQRMTYEQLTAKKWHAAEECIIRKQVLKKGYSDPYEKEYIRKDGTVFQVEVRTHLLREQNGIPTGMWAFVRDVTNRSKVRAALQESEEKFRMLFEKSFDPILVIDGDRFVECNQAAAEILGSSSKADLIGLYPADLSPVRQPDGQSSCDKAQQILDATFRNGMNRFEWVHRSLNGKNLWMDVSLTAVRAQGKTILYTVWRDITDRKRAEEELERKSRDLEETNTALSVLLNRKDQEKAALESSLLANVREVISPYLQRLRTTNLSDTQTALVEVVESNLENIVAPFVQKLAAAYSRFTPTQIQVANFIKDGRSSKEIGRLLNVSTGTVDTHRNNIRKKLGIAHKTISLRSYLLSL